MSDGRHDANDAGPAATYTTRVARFDGLARAHAERSRLYARWRLATAAGVVVVLVMVVREPTWWGAVALGLGCALFVQLVRGHDVVERAYGAALGMAALNREGLARLERRWEALSPWWTPSVDDDHPYAADLDVFGRASLAQVLGPVRTPTGREHLARWLLAGSTDSVAEIESRQAAVRELAGDIEFRQQLAVLATPTTDDRTTPSALTWAEAPSALDAQPWVPWVALALTAITLVGACGTLAGVVTGAWWLATGLAGWLLRWWVHVPLEATIGGAAGEMGLRPWTPLISHLHALRATSEPLTSARAKVADAPAALAHLEQLVALADVRHSAWVFVPLHTLTLWDLHVWWAIDRWRRRHGAHVRGWLDAVGRVEALAGLATLAFDQPTWTWPVLDAEAPTIEGREIGHPLLADGVRVGNDVRVGPPGRFLLITGSNMSGKSTLLRAVGLNVVIAAAGGPACAAALRLPRVDLRTSMRVSDSLERGLSLFMASLLRLQQVVTAARAATPSRRVCYLLDEVLQGTNSEERQIAVRTIVEHLLACEAIGIVTTHDLDLARDPAFTARAESVHLQETLSGTGADVVMSFDYRLRPGPAHAGNALRLLTLLGLRPDTA